MRCFLRRPSLSSTSPSGCTFHLHADGSSGPQHNFIVSRTAHLLHGVLQISSGNAEIDRLIQENQDLKRQLSGNGFR